GNVLVSGSVLHAVENDARRQLRVDHPGPARKPGRGDPLGGDMCWRQLADSVRCRHNLAILPISCQRRTPVAEGDGAVLEQVIAVHALGRADRLAGIDEDLAADRGVETGAWREARNTAV